MNTLKALSVKTFALSAIIALAAGCASVTDASLEEPQAPTTIDQTEQPEPATFGNGDEVEPIVNAPVE